MMAIKMFFVGTEHLTEEEKQSAKNPLAMNEVQEERTVQREQKRSFRKADFSIDDDLDDDDHHLQEQQISVAELISSSPPQRKLSVKLARQPESACEESRVSLTPSTPDDPSHSASVSKDINVPAWPTTTKMTTERKSSAPSPRDSRGASVTTSSVNVQRKCSSQCNNDLDFNDDDLAATPTPQRPVVPHSLSIPETVDENGLLVIHESDQPRRVSDDASTSRSDSCSDDDFLQASGNTVIAAPLYRNLSSSPPQPSSMDKDIARRRSGDAHATVIVGGRPLRTSASASHLPLFHTNSVTTTQSNFSNVNYSQHQHYQHYYPHHPHAHHPSHFSAQFSDSESVCSSDSMQDLAAIVNAFPSTSSGTPYSVHRQSSVGGAQCGFYTFRNSMAGAGAQSILSSSPNSGRGSYFSTHAQHQIPAVANVRSQSSAALGRTLSNTLLEDLANASKTTAIYGSGSGGVPYQQAPSYDYHQAKHLHTEQVVSKHTLKGRLSKFQRLLDKAFALINLGTEDSIVEGSGVVAKIMVNAWVAPKIGHDLAYGLCDYLREMSYFDLLLKFLLHPDTKQRVRLAAGRALEECLSAPNRNYLAVNTEILERFVDVAKSFKETEEVRMAVSLFESLFKQSAQTNGRLIELSALDYVLNACKATINSHTLRHAALALANLAMYSDSECQQRMIAKNVPDWLFLLASSHDDVTRYYACLAICILVSNKEIEAAVIKSGTLSLVEPFLLAHKPADFATSDYKHHQGRPREWLEKLVPLLGAKRRESRSMAAFHFAMEAGIKKDQESLEVLEQIGAVEALKQVAALPEEVAPKIASMALEIIGAEVPHKLSQQVPLWSVEDVQYWVTHIGFEKYSPMFAEQKVDGDLLLLLTDQELAVDIGMTSGLLRKRFMRELESLKMAADYTCIDETQMDRFLVSVDPHFSVYTYQLLELGVDRSLIPSLSEDVLKECGIGNPVHRVKLLQSMDECKHIDDMEVAILSKHIDIFISYRRSTGNQLASLIKVLLQLRGYKVFIDVDRLYAGKFDSSLLKNIQAAKHFVLVLTPHALDRCLDDDECNDWVHKEVLCALEHNKNIIPVFDPYFEWPDETHLPNDIRAMTRFNGVRWVHEYQEACVDKLEKFIEGELNMDRGLFSSPHLSCRPNSKTACGNQVTSPPDSTDFVLDALTAASRSRTSSHDLLLANNNNGHFINGVSPLCYDSTMTALRDQ